MEFHLHFNKTLGNDKIKEWSKRMILFLYGYIFVSCETEILNVHGLQNLKENMVGLGRNIITKWCMLQKSDIIKTLPYLYRFRNYKPYQRIISSKCEFFFLLNTFYEMTALENTLLRKCIQIREPELSCFPCSTIFFKSWHLETQKTDLI